MYGNDENGQANNNSTIHKYRSLNHVCHSLIGFVNKRDIDATLQSRKSQTINLNLEIPLKLIWI